MNNFVISLIIFFGRIFRIRFVKCNELIICFRIPIRIHRSVYRIAVFFLFEIGKVFTITNSYAFILSSTHPKLNRISVEFIFSGSVCINNRTFRTSKQ